MAATTPENWQASDLALTRFSATAESGRGYKRLFGSELAFRDDGVLDLHAGPDVAARPSYALGGLSNVWGSGLLPYTDSDLEGFPIAAAELAAGYRAVLEFVPYAGEEDELSERYPLLRTPDGPLIRSPAGEELLARLRRHARTLGRAGYHFGAPRLALRVGHPAPANGCIYCGHCLDGCPYGHIYNAAQTIEQLRRGGRIEYRPGLHVDRVLERDVEVMVEATPLEGGPPLSLRGSRAFLAAGAVSTTVILQRSGLLPARSEILDSQALYLPFFWIGRSGRTGREPGHTLAQTMIVLDDPAVAANPIHLALYTYNDGLSERAREVHPRLSSLAGPALEAVTRRLAVGICFFHSDDSHRVASNWREDRGAVELEPVINPTTAATVRRFQRALLRSLGPLGLVPLAPLAELAPAGGGYHYGGSIPMRSRPRFGESDTLGRPAATRLIHVVDGSCFPSVPGGAITFSAMANAHRIASAVVRAGPA
jgi:choline dehydrogenase-like flavoprotein